MWTLTKISLVLLMVTCVLAGLERTCNVDDISSPPHQNGVCGDMAYQILSTLCRFYGRFRRDTRSEPIKRSLRLPVLLKRPTSATFLKSKRSSGRQSFTCECCHNQCSQYELLEYC